MLLTIQPMVTTPREEAHEFFSSLGTDERMTVTFQPSKRHVAKKMFVDENVEIIEEAEEQPKKRAKGQPHHKIARKSTRRTSACPEPSAVVGKRQRRHFHSDRPEPSAAAEKQQRRHFPEPAQPSTTCCLHGLSCQHAEIDEEAHFECLARRIAHHMPLDDSEAGWIARLAHKLLNIVAKRSDESASISESRLSKYDYSSC